MARHHHTAPPTDTGARVHGSPPVRQNTQPCPSPLVLTSRRTERRGRISTDGDQSLGCHPRRIQMTLSAQTRKSLVQNGILLGLSGAAPGRSRVSCATAPRRALTHELSPRSAHRAEVSPGHELGAGEPLEQAEALLGPCSPAQRCFQDQTCFSWTPSSSTPLPRTPRENDSN